METRQDDMERWRAALLAAALPHVPFDGWSDRALAGASADSGIEAGLARALFPRGGVDLARAYHLAGDRAMHDSFAAAKTDALRYRDKVALAIRLRLAASDRELVRHGSALFALPAHAGEGAGLIWGTADRIWQALGDTSRDFNWYSKRATLSAVYGATVLYWLGDSSEAGADTDAFIDRRIEDVMRFEKAKAGFLGSSLGQALARGPLAVLGRVRAPQGQDDFPGHFRT